MAEKKVWFGFEYFGSINTHLRKTLETQNVRNPQIVEEIEQKRPEDPMREKIVVQGFISEIDADILHAGLEEIGMATSIEYIATESVDKMPHHLVDKTLLSARDN